MRSFKPGSQAVFSRNWSHYLAEAAKHPERVTVFQSRVRWVSGKAAAPCPIYFCAMPEDGSDPTNKVEYAADLVEVRIDPTQTDATWLGQNALKKTREEGLWGNTLYAIRNCRQRKNITLTDLRLVSAGDRPLSEDYSRSHAIVRELA